LSGAVGSDGIGYARKIMRFVAGVNRKAFRLGDMNLEA